MQQIITIDVWTKFLLNDTKLLIQKVTLLYYIGCSVRAVLSNVLAVEIIML